MHTRARKARGHSLPNTMPLSSSRKRQRSVPSLLLIRPSVVVVVGVLILHYPHSWWCWRLLQLDHVKSHVFVHAGTTTAFLSSMRGAGCTGNRCNTISRRISSQPATATRDLSSGQIRRDGMGIFGAAQRSSPPERIHQGRMMKDSSSSTPNIVAARRKMSVSRKMSSSSSLQPDERAANQEEDDDSDKIQNKDIESSSKSRKYPVNSVVSRIARATEKAAHRAQAAVAAMSTTSSSSMPTTSSRGNQVILATTGMGRYPTASSDTPASSSTATATRNHSSSNDNNNNNVNHHMSPLSSTTGRPAKLASLTQLNRAMDQKLLARDSLSSTMNRAVPRDSMTNMVSYNYQQEVLDQHRDTMNLRSRFGAQYVAIVFGKALIHDQISVEYACRIRRLVRALKHEDYKPGLICFLRGYENGIISSPSHRTTHRLEKNQSISSVQAGYLYFRHLCAAQGVHLSPDLRFYVGDDTTTTTTTTGGSSSGGGGGDDSSALLAAVKFIQTECLPMWEQARIRVYFALVSSDYHLCQLHDLHLRSPRESPLRALLQSNWMDMIRNSSSKIVETRWTYWYATTGPFLGSDEQDYFLYKCYQTAQQLRPVVVNLRGVVENREFFQKENYLVLVAARRSLVNDMEEIYHLQPSLKSVQRLAPCTDDSKPLDVVLESALLSLGRSADLVRPAGLFTGSVPATDWRMALSILEQAMLQIAQTCNPDRPLDPFLWGQMIEEEDGDDGHDADNEDGGGSSGIKTKDNADHEVESAYTYDGHDADNEDGGGSSGIKTKDNADHEVESAYTYGDESSHEREASE